MTSFPAMRSASAQSTPWPENPARSLPVATLFHSFVLEPSSWNMPTIARKSGLSSPLPCRIRVIICRITAGSTSNAEHSTTSVQERNARVSKYLSCASVSVPEDSHDSQIALDGVANTGAAQDFEGRQMGPEHDTILDGDTFRFLDLNSPRVPTVKGHAPNGAVERLQILEGDARAEIVLPEVPELNVAHVDGAFKLPAVPGRALFGLTTISVIFDTIAGHCSGSWPRLGRVPLSIVELFSLALALDDDVVRQHTNLGPHLHAPRPVRFQRARIVGVLERGLQHDDRCLGKVVQVDLRCANDLCLVHIPVGWRNHNLGSVVPVDQPFHGDRRVSDAAARGQINPTLVHRLPFRDQGPHDA
eukprot:3114816-Rhodomonas_salina.1